MPSVLAWTESGLVAGAIYFGTGGAFALLVTVLGAQRMDAGAAGMPWSARLLIFPGLVALWPLLLKKWLTGQQPPVS